MIPVGEMGDEPSFNLTLIVTDLETRGSPTLDGGSFSGGPIGLSSRLRFFFFS